MTTSGQQTTASTGQPATDRRQSYPRWPVALLAAAAYVAIWGGWVELGRMSGFGPVNLLPGITNLEVDLSITLPLGMEVYAAYAMGAWLTKKNIDPSARSFAKWSTFASLAIGMSGQIAYHLLAAAGIEKAPVPVVVGVACVSVVVLGMASMLAHRLHVPAEISATTEASPVGLLDDEEIDPAIAHQDVSMPVDVAAETDRPVGRMRRPVTDDERAIILQLAESLSEREVARRTKRSRDTVRRVLEDVTRDEPVNRSATQSGTEPTSRPADGQVWPLTA